MLYHENAERLRRRAARGEPCLGVHCSTGSPQVIELLGHVGLDFAILSTEVESVDPAQLENMMRAADASGLVPMVKLRRNDPALVGDALNAGAPLAMVPHIRSRAELDAALAAARFPPRGVRGLCPAARYAGFGARSTDLARDAANEYPAVVPILEDREALDHLDEIMACPDVEIVEIGPFDLSLSLGVTPHRAYENPETLAAIDRICAAAARAGKRLLAPLWMPANLAGPELVALQRERLLSRGITLLYQADVIMLARAYRELLPLRGSGGDP